ncbi:MAG: fibronectin type III domain-containing protein [Chromatiaceae bacterium]|jgi:hypothetical protein|nr:fibronectin type III domain-containing protein [Chromatiaceae bacterium]
MKLKNLSIGLILFGLAGFSGCTSTVGLGVVQPEHEATVSSLQPTLQWKAVEGPGVTYDVVIYESDGMTPAYYREGLPGTTHTVEEDLKPGTLYRWSVRSRQDGKVAEWTMHETQVFTGVSYHRRTKYMEFSTPE